MTTLEIFFAQMGKQRKESWFYHFTAASNLLSIKIKGILSKRVMEALDIDYVASGSAQSRKSELLSRIYDYISLSLTVPSRTIT
jgi:hypothetical protein